jgi:hypothetical protein
LAAWDRLVVGHRLVRQELVPELPELARLEQDLELAAEP